MEACLSFGSIADYLIRRKFASEIEQSQALDIIAEAKSKGMVNIGDNVQNEPNFMCNCCRCCCEVLNSFKNFDFFTNTFSSNFEAMVSSSDCEGCKKCFKACPVEAIDMVESTKASNGNKNSKTALVNKDTCIGCGVCIPSCKQGALEMKPRPKRQLVPENTIARTLMMAIEKGTLKKLLVDKHSSMSTAAIGAFVAAIPKLPPGKQLLAKEAIKSRFVDFLMSKDKSR
jgi:NAD-dependent dihydropyrimidine dehydrogenase PreA subunit